MQTQFVFMRLGVKQQTSDNYDVGSARQRWRLNKPIKCVEVYSLTRGNRLELRNTKTRS